MNTFALSTLGHPYKIRKQDTLIFKGTRGNLERYATFNLLALRVWVRGEGNRTNLNP